MNNNMKKIILLITVCFLSIHTLSAYGQGIEISSIKANLNDGSAFRAPVDSNGNQCGLVKVKSNIKNINFEGEIIGDVKYDMNEYLIFKEPLFQSKKETVKGFIPSQLFPH